MEQGFTTEGGEFKPLTEAEQEWGSELMRSHRLSPDTQNGVMSYGRCADDNDALWIAVGLNTNLDDKDTYPDEFDGNRVIYERLPLAEPQSMDDFELR